MDYKYALVVSQYYHSYHIEIIEIGNMDKDVYKLKLKEYVKDIIKYKNNNTNNYRLGDFEDTKYRELKCRHEVFDGGGNLYVLHFVCLGDVLMGISRVFEKFTESKYPVNFDYRSRDRVMEAIAMHHSKSELREIYNKHFSYR